MKEALQFSVSTVSLQKASIGQWRDIVFKDLATQTTIERAFQMQAALSEVIHPENFSVSIHLGRVIDAQEIARSIQASSIDYPDIKTRLRLVHDIAESLVQQTLRQPTLPIRNHGGWYLQSEGTQKTIDRKLMQSRSLLQHPKFPEIFRINSSVLRGLSKEQLLQKFSAAPDAFWAVENNPNETPDEYIRFLEHLKIELAGQIRIMADLDLGKFAQSKHHLTDHQIDEPLQILRRFLTDSNLSQFVATVSLNQYVAGEAETHAHLLRGPINFIEAAGMLGTAVRNEMLQFAPLVIAEFHPADYSDMIDRDGLRYWAHLIDEYDEKLGINF